jgi:hypothetical protein
MTRFGAVLTCRFRASFEEQFFDALGPKETVRMLEDFEWAAKGFGSTAELAPARDRGVVFAIRVNCIYN